MEDNYNSCANIKLAIWKLSCDVVTDNCPVCRVQQYFVFLFFSLVPFPLGHFSKHTKDIQHYRSTRRLYDTYFVVVIVTVCVKTVGRMAGTIRHSDIINSAHTYMYSDDNLYKIIHFFFFVIRTVTSLLCFVPFLSGLLRLDFPLNTESNRRFHVPPRNYTKKFFQ